MIRRPAARIAALLVLASLPMIGCETFSARREAALYGPSEGVLEIVAVLRRHVPDDTYRFPPATDFSGRNVYRASLLRLESLERTEVDAFRSEYMAPVILFAKARALERLRAYDLAAQHYRESARQSDEMAPEALASAEICDRLAAAIRVGIDLRDPLGAAAGVPRSLDVADVRFGLNERITQLSILEEELGDSHYRHVAREEIERADATLAHYFVSMRDALADGTLIALQELQRVASRHGASKNRLRHLLRLADFYAALATEYLDAIPPAELAFDPARFGELSDAAIQLYQLVSGHDGRPEKLEAARKLEAFLALTLTIDADRFDR